MSTHNLCFEQKYEKYQSFSSENFPFLEVKFSIYLNRHVFVMFFMFRASISNDSLLLLTLLVNWPHKKFHGLRFSVGETRLHATH